LPRWWSSPQVRARAASGLCWGVGCGLCFCDLCAIAQLACCGRPSPPPTSSPSPSPNNPSSPSPPGLKEYAEPIIDAIDPCNALIAARVYREGTTRTEHYSCVKDMARVGRRLGRTVLVDDTPLAFLHQPANGVPVLGFRGDPDDRLLGEAVLPLLQVRVGGGFGGWARGCGGF